MRKPEFFVVLLILMTLGCKPVDTKMEYKLQDEQLANLMMDIQWSEITLAELSMEKKDSLKDLFWLRLTAIYDLSAPEIKSEIEKLGSDPEKMKEIMDRVKIKSDSIR